MVAVNCLPCLRVLLCSCSYITMGTRRHTQRVPSANVTVTYSWPRGCLITMPRFTCQLFMSPQGNKCMLSNALSLTTANYCPHLPIDGGAIRHIGVKGGCLHPPERDAEVPARLPAGPGPPSSPCVSQSHPDWSK